MLRITCFSELHFRNQRRPPVPIFEITRRLSELPFDGMRALAKLL
jgi:hypothetical protein